MTISLAFFLDQNLTMPITSTLDFEQAVDGSTGPEVRVIYLGSTASNRKYEAEINSGVSPIMLSIIDNQIGGGQGLRSIKLALDPNDLINVAPGEALALSATLLSGITNVIPIYVQIEDQTGIVGTDTSLSLATNTIVETEYFT